MAEITYSTQSLDHLGIVAGVILDAAPVGGVATAGDNTIISRVEVVSDAAGRASIDNIPADSGTYYINFGGVQKKLSSVIKIIKFMQ